jgi:FtsZ-interacting cell division protein ZipA
MKLNMTIANVLVLVLIIALIAFLMFGCINITYTVEDFKDMAASKKDKDVDDDDEDDVPSIGSRKDVGDASLTAKEKELFEDLKNNKLSTDEITDLVKGGVLTEKLVERFLSQLNAQVDDVPAPPVSSSSSNSKKASKATKDVEDDVVEGFQCGEKEYAAV